MSLFRKILKGVGKVAGFIPGPIGKVAKIGSVIAGGVGATKMATRGALPAIRSLPGVGAVTKAAPRIGRTVGRVAGAAGTAATGVAIYDAAGNYMGQRAKSKRINPLNHRALKRAIRRIERTKHIMKRLGAITIRKEKC